MYDSLPPQLAVSAHQGVELATPRGLKHPISYLQPQDTPPVSIILRKLLDHLGNPAHWRLRSPHAPPPPFAPSTVNMAAPCVSSGTAISYRILLRGRVSLASGQGLWKAAAADLQTGFAFQVRPGRSGSTGPHSARMWSQRRHLPLVSRMPSDGFLGSESVRLREKWILFCTNHFGCCFRISQSAVRGEVTCRSN